MNRDPKDSLKDIIECWRNSPYPSYKVSNYFQVYADLFSHLRGTECTFIETGIFDGGSLFMWRSWLGEKARIIGVDLNPAALKWRDHGFEIFIGDQGDPEFWRKTFAEIGPFDAFLDDGGHQSFQQIVTAYEAIGAARGPCVIAVEDTITNFMREFANQGDRSFLNYAKAATDNLTARHVNLFPGPARRSQTRRSSSASKTSTASSSSPAWSPSNSIRPPPRRRAWRSTDRSTGQAISATTAWIPPTSNGRTPSTRKP